MSTFEPGTVAVATVRGVPNVRVMRYKEGASGDWFSDSQIHGAYYSHLDSDVTDVRPLVVLDLDGIAPEAIVAGLRSVDGGTNSTGWARVADQIEAQTKPRRIPEPGRWGVVRAHTSSGGEVFYDEPIELVRTADDIAPWRCARGAYDWVDLIDPVLIREGAER